MERKCEVVFRPKTVQRIKEIAIYIESNGFPDTAKIFANRLFDFVESLAHFPNKYPICRKKPLVKRMIRCAVFKKNYIFIYKCINEELVIYDIFHAKSIS